jgi:hypothetical protein
MRAVRGTASVFQGGDELCRVEYHLSESRTSEADEFAGTLELLAGIPLNVGLPNLSLTIRDGRRVAFSIVAVEPRGRRELYRIRGRADFG